MAFADEVVKDGRAYAMRFDVSTDNFATIAYRWATHGGTVNEASTEVYTANVQEVGPLSRGFGVNGVTGASSMELVLDNTSGALDWMFLRTNYYNVTRLRIRAYLVVWDAADGFGNETEEKQLGDFHLGDMPRRDEARVTLNLVDAIIGRLDGAALRLPTIAKFSTAWLVAESEILERPQGVDRLTVPLAFGRSLLAGPWLLRTGSGVHRLVMPIRSGGSTSTNFTFLWALQAGTPEEAWIEVPPTADLSDGASAQNRTIWSTSTRAVTDDDGVARTVRYLELYVRWFVAFALVGIRAPVNAGGLTPGEPAFQSSADGKPPDSDRLSEALRRQREAWADYDVGSYQVTLANATQATAGQDAYLYSAAAVDFVLKQLLVVSQNDTTHGADAIASVVDALPNAPSRYSAGFTTMKTSVPNANAKGLVYGGDNVRETVSAIAGSVDLDVFTMWDGKISLSGDYFEALLGTGDVEVSFSDVDTASCSSDFPAIGERGAAYSVVTAGNETLFFQFGTTDTDGRGSRVELDAEWAEQALTGRRLPTMVRPRIRFVTDARALVLELGDYFQFTWTRNIATAFNAAYFQVQRLAYSFQRGTVEVEALWRKDSDEPWPYLLDDQTYHTRATGSGGRTATVTDASDTVTFSSGNLTSDGVVEGDILVLLDSTQAADTFTRFRALRIDSVNSATSLRLAELDLDFDTPGGTAVSSWEIRGGALSVTAPTGANYVTTEWEKYGKAGDVAVGGTFSDTTTKANKFGGG